MGLSLTLLNSLPTTTCSVRRIPPHSREQAATTSILGLLLRILGWLTERLSVLLTGPSSQGRALLTLVRTRWWLIAKVWEQREHLRQHQPRCHHQHQPQRHQRS